MKEVTALAPGCAHTLVEVPSHELPWSLVGGLIGTLAAEEPGRTFVLSTDREGGLVSCANATRPAQWKRFIRVAPRPRPAWRFGAPLGDLGDAGL